jgi:hypothetical protein
VTLWPLVTWVFQSSVATVGFGVENCGCGIGRHLGVVVVVVASGYEAPALVIALSPVPKISKDARTIVTTQGNHDKFGYSLDCSCSNSWAAVVR